MHAEELIKELKQQGDLNKWLKIIDEGDKDYVTGTWYNLVMMMAENIEDQMCDITRSMWEFGMQGFDWDYLYELLVKEKDSTANSGCSIE